MAPASPEEPLSTPRPRALLPVLLLLLFGFGFAVGLHYARLGFHPLDGSIVFDGAWRILSGQVPLRDFDTPDSIVPSLLQAFAFRAFGVNWFVYCAHAAVINGLFCVVVFLLLRALAAGPWLATGYALLSGLVLYPPFGVPFREQHAFFFTALGLLAAVGAPRVRPAWLSGSSWLCSRLGIESMWPAICWRPSRAVSGGSAETPQELGTSGSSFVHFPRPSPCK